MKSAFLAGLFASVLCLLAAASPALAQGVGSSGTINGTVVDPAGAVVPKAAVIATETDRGVAHATETDSYGYYRLTGLPPTTYDVTARAPGFDTVLQKGLVVTVGSITLVDFHLAISSSKAVVEVSAVPPIVETERGSEANTITQNYIEDLPINRRDYLNFTLLLPGVSDSTRIADDQDFRVKQTPQSGLSFYGSNGRGNSVTVDGGETGTDSGGVRTTVSQDGVQEFQVNRSNYPADLGGASGASVNIVTKSGGNDLHGSVYGYFRNDALDARDPFAFSQALQPGEVFNPFDPDSTGSPVKNSLGRYQFGGAVGFPIHKDKTFGFLAFEGLRQDAENAVPLLLDTSALRPTAPQQAVINSLAEQGNTPVSCINGQPMLPAAICAQALASALTTSSLTGLTEGQSAINDYLVNQFENNGGLFNYSTRQYLFSGRLDHRFSDVNSVSLTYRYGHDLEANPDVQSLTGFSAGSSIHNYDDNIQGSWYHIFSPRSQNELRIQYDYNHFNVIPNEAGQAGLQIPGFINNLGTNIFLPNLTILRRTEFADNYTMIRGRHTIKFGGSELLRGNHTESHTFLPARFVFGSLPGFFISPQLAGTELTSLQSASFGLPQFYQQGFGDPDYPAYTRPLTGLFVQDSWQIKPNFTLNFGLRYEIDSQFQPLNTYYHDFAPRISFAWDPFNDHKTVIRGGYGIFYGNIDAQIPQVDLSLGVLNRNHSTVENQRNKHQVPDQVNNLVSTCGVAFPVGPPIIPGTGTSPCTRFISIYADSLLPTPLPIVTADVVFQTLFANGLIQCTTPPPGQNACITPQSLGPQSLGGVFPDGPFGLGSGILPTNSGPISPLTVTFSNPPNYRAPYSQQASLAVEREVAPGLSVSLSFIYSHTVHLPVAIDTNLLPSTPMSNVTLANGRNVSYRNWNTSPNTDPLGGTEGLPCEPNPFLCFVNPLVVQNNQYTASSSGLYEGGILQVTKRLSNNFSLFANYTYSKAFDTGTDFNTDFGPQDPTDLSLDRALSPFDERHKVVIAAVINSPWQQAALKGFSLSPVFQYHSGHPFNLNAGGEVNGNNHTTNERPIGANRDTGLGPNYVDFDMRLSWSHKIGERGTLQLTAEGFNIANHTNYASVNNVVSPLFGFQPSFTTFNVHGSAELAPNQPLGFTSALPKREIQLGARFSF
ncbi:MAG: TonB-dependent receptor domain-containing protein [Candidatus Acidiferrales bacterium]